MTTGCGASCFRSSVSSYRSSSLSPLVAPELISISPSFNDFASLANLQRNRKNEINMANFS